MYKKNPDLQIILFSDLRFSLLPQTLTPIAIVCCNIDVTQRNTQLRYCVTMNYRSQTSKDIENHITDFLLHLRLSNSANVIKSINFVA
jgi:hypothetical protein